MPEMDFQMAGFLFAFFGGLFLFLFAVWLTWKRDRIPAYKKDSRRQRMGMRSGNC